VFVVAALLLLLAIGLLGGGLVQGSATLQWAAFAASALAAVLLGVSEVRRRRRASAPERVRTGSARGPSVASVDPGRPVGGPGPPATRTTGPTIPVPASAATAPTGTAPTGTEPTGTEPTGAGPTAPGNMTSLPEVAPPPAAEPLGTLAEPIGPTTGAHAASDEQALPMAPRSVGAHSAEQPAALALGEDGEPPVEEVEVTDLLLVLDLTDDVLVVDEHPRYHLSGCPHLPGQQTFALPMVEARTDGFTPCATCAPDRHLARSERARRAGP
jgi:hypothetical protein